MGNDTQFARMCSLLNLPALATDPLYATNAARVRNRQSLLQRLRAVLQQQPVQHWVTLLAAAGVPCGPINSVQAALEDPHATAHQLRQRVRIESAQRENDTAGAVPVTDTTIPAGFADVISNPIRVGGGSSAVMAARGVPSLGAHTDDVLLRVLQYSEEQVRQLRAAGAVA